MSETAAAIIWVVGIIVWLAIRLPHRRKARRTAVVTDRRSHFERIALGLCIVGLVVLPALHLTTGIFGFADYSFQWWAGWLGLDCMLGFLVIFYLSHKHLGKNWSVTLELREDHGLVQSGIYKYVRHPMYTSFWLWGLAQALLIPNWVAGLAGLVSVAILYFGRVNQEEAMMREQFGAEYEAYCAKTKRIIPGLI